MTDDDASAVNPKPDSPYQVLARAYRPQCFEDLIGQDAMVRTLTNAFKRARIPHAYMLTGVRGVGKTTTARLLARALNYETQEGERRPQISLDPQGVHCARIAAGTHPDILEMDAASHTGVNDVRDILDNARYAPQDAAFKVYIIDEVHMLSTAAFNALLKTLEEPPPHVKFIFATTEIRKVPVTILSRCQRFDLRRIPLDMLMAHLRTVLSAEGVDTIPDDGLRIIARAAEGSVRDALSLLDQAILQGPDVSVAAIADMMGLADRALTLDLMGEIIGGETGKALTRVDDMVLRGADPVAVMKDLLDHCYQISRADLLGSSAQFDDAGEVVTRYHGLAGQSGTGKLARLWQMLLKADQDIRHAPDSRDALAMAVIRLAHAAHLPGPEEAAALFRGGSGPNGENAGAGIVEDRQLQQRPRNGPESRSDNRGSPSTIRTGGPPADRTRSPSGHRGAVALKLVEPELEVEPNGLELPPWEVWEGAGEADAVIGANGSQTLATGESSDQNWNESPDENWDQYAPVSAEEETLMALLPSSLSAISALAGDRRDLNLKYNIDHFVRPHKVEDGRMECSLISGAPGNMQANLVRRLSEWTGVNWLVTVSAEKGGETLAEIRAREQAEQLAIAAAHPTVKALLKALPDAVLERVVPRDRTKDKTP
jgi:DNA polymerase III subunit gamma/tau